MSIWDKNLKTFREELASGSPTPGGGSAAMVSGVLGASLFSMALEISAKRAGADPKLAELRPQLNEIMEKLAAAADKDIVAYEGYVAAKNADDAAKDKALEQSFMAPFEGAELILEALRIGKQMAPFLSKSITSDLIAGTALLTGALHAAAATADANLAYIKDANLKAQLSEKLRNLLTKGSQL